MYLSELDMMVESILIAMNHYFRDVPDYYDTMYMDGYSPEQILHAAHQTMIREYEARKAAQRAAAEENEIPNVKIISEVKVRR